MCNLNAAQSFKHQQQDSQEFSRLPRNFLKSYDFSYSEIANTDIRMLLDLSNISKTYESKGRQVQALDHASLAIDGGEFVAVRGPSGCGKTTLLLIAGGLLAPDTGTLTIDGKNPYDMPANERAQFRGSTIGFVFQQFHLVPYLSVLDNVLAPAMATGLNGAKDHALELISHFGLEHRVDHVPGQLSTGERQRTALARAMLNKPKILLADEPTGNLDRDNADSVLGFMDEFVKDGGAVLLVTHDDNAAARAGRTETIQDGRLVHDPSIIAE